jgi:hypothetical protein
MKGMTYEERMAYRRLEFGRRIRYIPKTRNQGEHPELAELKERKKFFELKESPTVKEMEKQREIAMDGGNILIYEGKRNKKWREYVSQKIKQWEREFDTLKTKYPRSTTKIPNAKAVLDSDKEWLRATTPETTDKQHKERENKKVELIEKTRREQQKEAEEKKEAAEKREQEEKRQWEEDQPRRIAEANRLKEQRIAVDKETKEYYDKKAADFNYFYESTRKDEERDNPTMSTEAIMWKIVKIWNNMYPSKQQEWIKEQDRLNLVAFQEEQKKIAEENQRRMEAIQRVVQERNERLERVKRNAERDSDVRANLEKIGLENMADFVEDVDLYKEKLKRYQEDPKSESAPSIYKLEDKIKEYDDIHWFYYGENPIEETNLNFVKNTINIKEKGLSLRQQMYLRCNAKVNVGNESGTTLWCSKYSDTHVLGNKTYGPLHGKELNGKPRKDPFKTGNFVDGINYMN